MSDSPQRPRDAEGQKKGDIRALKRAAFAAEKPLWEICLGMVPDDQVYLEIQKVKNQLAAAMDHFKFGVPGNVSENHGGGEREIHYYSDPS